SLPAAVTTDSVASLTEALSCSTQTSVFMGSGSSKSWWIEGDQAIPSSLILATSVSTSGTLMPAWRTGGSETLRVLRRGAVSATLSAGGLVARGFSLAFIVVGGD